MWNHHLPSDLLGRILSILPPDSSACAASACKDWYSCIRSLPSEGATYSIPHPWFLAITHHSHSCFAYNFLLKRWYVLPLDSLPNPIHPIAPIGNLILCRPSNSSLFELALCNPFTKQYKSLPSLNAPRTTPAVGMVKLNHADHDLSSFNFRIFVAGGLSVSSRGCSGGSSYEPTVEMYDSQVKRWQTLGLMPVDIAVRLTVWTPNESVYSNGILYWITSARAYSIMGFNICSGVWTEVNVPMADKLEFAALVRRGRGKGCLTLVGGKSGEEACIWELGARDVWMLIERVPVELGRRFTGSSRGSWCNTKCVGTDQVIYLYKDLKSEMLVWKEVKESGWEWSWVEGCCSIRGQQVPKFSIKGILLLPGIGPSIPI